MHFADYSKYYKIVEKWILFQPNHIEFKVNDIYNHSNGKFQPLYTPDLEETNSETREKIYWDYTKEIMESRLIDIFGNDIKKTSSEIKSLREEIIEELYRNHIITNKQTYYK
jgi:hypothetical protein